MLITKGRVSQNLGSGTFGSVWKVEQDSSPTKLAYKVYHGQELKLTEKLSRFRRGYSAMKQLDHPHIVKVHEFTECPVGFYMDFIDGPNLRNFTGTVEDPQSIVTILLTVAETLAHAHRRGVVHRDVKPENLVMNYETHNGQWRPYLTDFDLAWFSTATQVFTREAMGSVYYASPEQYATPTSASAHAPTTDIYSFGQLAFFAVTGSDPVPLGVADNYKALEKRLGIPGWFAQGAENFLKLYKDCTEQKPDKRPQDFREICDRLFRISQALSAFAAAKHLSTEQFINEVVFSLAGISPGRHFEKNSFSSLSGKTQVRINVTREQLLRVDLSFEFHSQEPPVLEGVQTFEQLRKILFGRIDSVLDEFSEHGSVTVVPRRFRSLSTLTILHSLSTALQSAELW